MSDREFGRFVKIARGSNQEVLAQLLIAESLGFQQPPQSKVLLAQVERVGALLSGVLKRMERTE